MKRYKWYIRYGNVINRQRYNDKYYNSVKHFCKVYCEFTRFVKEFSEIYGVNENH